MVNKTTLAWVVIAPVLAWTVFRRLELESGYPLVPVVAFSSYVAMAAVIPVLITLLLRRPLPAAVGAVAVGLLLWDVAPRVLAEEPPAGQTVRVMSLNLLTGMASPSAVVGLVEREQVDIVALQELTPAAVERLDASGFQRRFPRRQLRPKSGARGSGIYARRAIRLEPLTDPRVGEDLFLTARAALRVGGAAPVDMLSVHLTSPKSDPAARLWEEDFEALPAATPRSPLRMLAGDFNATLDHRVFRELLGTGYRDAAEVAGAGLKPTRERDDSLPLPTTIDHIVVDERIGVAHFSAHDVPGSDHRAVVATLVLPGRDKNHVPGADAHDRER